MDALSREVCEIEKDYEVFIVLYGNVQNTQLLIDNVRRGELPAAVLSPKLIFSKLQLLTAATKAVHSFKRNTMTTKSLHSEVLYSLSPTKNISQCFKLFGVSEKDSSLIIVEAVKPDETQMSSICDLVDGTPVMIENLHTINNVEQIKKVYKIKEEELKVGDLEEAILGRMASKNVITF